MVQRPGWCASKTAEALKVIEGLCEPEILTSTKAHAQRDLAKPESCNTLSCATKPIKIVVVSPNVLLNAALLEMSPRRADAEASPKTR